MDVSPVRAGTRPSSGRKRSQVQRQYEYFAIVDDAHPSPEEPAALRRRWVDDGGRVHDEMFTTELVWATVPAPDGVPHRVGVEVATQFQEALRERALRHGQPDAPVAQYTYFAWVEDWGKTQEDPTGLLRTWLTPGGFEREERYTPGSGWARSFVREEWHRGRYDGRFDKIDHAAAERIIELWEQRRTEQA